MGVLAVAGLGDGGGAPAADPAPEPGQREPEIVGPGPGNDGGGEERPPESRRERAAREMRETIERELTTRLKPFEDRIGETRREAEQRIAQVQQENARLYGQIEALQRQPAPAAPTAPRPDPADLKRQARAALDANKFDEYERLTELASDARDAARWEEREKKLTQQFSQQMQQAPQPLPPWLTGLIGRHENVAMAGQRGEALVTNKVQALQLNGWQPGPQTVAKAFELVEAELKAAGSQQRQTTPQFDRATAGALGGVPRTGSGSGAGGGGDGAGAPKLTAAEEEARKAAKMSVEEYNEWRKDPEKAAAKRRNAKRRPADD